MRSILILIFTFLFALNLAAEGKNQTYPRFNVLKKITLGPDDQLDGAISKDSKYLVFTKKANMISHLQIKNLSSGEIKDLLPLDADSMQAKFNNKGQIAFVYYKNNSRGDICFTEAITPLTQLPLKITQIRCLPRQEKNLKCERLQVSWMNEDEVLFLEKREGYFAIVQANGANYNTATILESENPISSPNTNSNGRYIVFNQIINKELKLVLFDRQSKLKTIVPIFLPGVTGLASVSSDEQSIYFSQYMGDSNQDAIIDGHDNAVVLRIRVKDILALAPKTEESWPEISIEQLTPMDYNCSYPFESLNSIYLTCAFQGSLDLYEMPHDGVVPTYWGTKTLENAFASARSYQDRILLLNTMKFKTKDLSLHNSLDERLMNIHILADEIAAGLFYLGRISSSKKGAQSSHYKLLEIYLKARQMKRTQPKDIITLEFKAAIAEFNRQIFKITGENEFKMFVQANFSAMLGHKPNLNTLALHLNQKKSPILYLLFFRAAEESLTRVKEHIKDWLPIYKAMIKGSSLNFESQLYYAYELLSLLEITDNTERAALLNQFKKDLPMKSDVLVIFDGESSIIELVSAKEDKAKLLALQHLNQLMEKYKDNYFLRKTLNIRTILNFLKFQEFKYLNVTAANWIRDTPKNSTEFSYARQVVIKTALEQAYGFWLKKSPRLSADYFFQSLSLTDDLESYSGYLNTMIEIGQRKNMEERLLYLRNHQVMVNGAAWVDALILLQDAKNERDLDGVLKILNNIQPDLADPMKSLLIGSIYLEKTQRNLKGVEIDQEFSRLAHENLILALDLSKENRRIRAAALTNLGLLHLWKQNYGQSLRFWELRKEIGFEDPEHNLELKAFSWYYAESLFLANQQRAAAAVMTAVPQTLSSPEFVERRAFYLAMDQNWKEAIIAYRKLEDTQGVDFEHIQEPSRTKIRLGKAYTLFKLGELSQAKALFQKIINQKSQHLEVKDQFRKMAFESKDINSIALGFLAQLGTKEEQQAALAQRIELLKEDLPTLIHAQVKLAELESVKNPRGASELMFKSLKNLSTYTADNGPLGQTVLKTLMNCLVHGIYYPEFYRGLSSETLNEQVNKTLKAMNHQIESASLYSLKEQWRLQYLWFLYQENVIADKSQSEWRKEMQNSTLAEKIIKQDPKGFETLQNKMAKLTDF